MKQTTRNVGDSAEQLVASYLLKHGLKLVEKNYTCKLGEIDLVMQDGNTLVFIEVRSRKNQKFMHTFETIDLRKQRKIINTSLNFLQRYPAYRHQDIRFDAVAVIQNQKYSEIDWIKNAFDA